MLKQLQLQFHMFELHDRFALSTSQIYRLCNTQRCLHMECSIRNTNYSYASAYVTCISRDVTVIRFVFSLTTVENRSRKSAHPPR